MIRVVLVDDHPALRSGLETVLRAEPGLVPVGAAASAVEAMGLLRRSPDVVVLDYHLPGEDGLLLCRRIKQQLPTVRVLLYSAFAGSSLAVAAKLAGADGLLSKGVAAGELCAAIRGIHGGESVTPPIPAAVLDDAAERVEQEDLPILGMLLGATPESEIAEVLGVESARLQGRIEAMIRRLRVEVPDLDF